MHRCPECLPHALAAIRDLGAPIPPAASGRPASNPEIADTLGDLTGWTPTTTERTPITIDIHWTDSGGVSRATRLTGEALATALKALEETRIAAEIAQDGIPDDGDLWQYYAIT